MDYNVTQGLRVFGRYIHGHYINNVQPVVNVYGGRPQICSRRWPSGSSSM
jgi:hypothetical protein